MRLKIENISLAQISRKDDGAKIQFDISWEKAWKNNVNCDGVWFFAKFREGAGNWKHVTLKAQSSNKFDYSDQTPTGFSKGVNGTSAEMGLWAPDTKKGGFIFRTKGEGDVSSNKVTIIWDYASDGVEGKDFKQIQIKVFGLEMVYLPQSLHYVGDPKGPNGPKNCLFTYPDNGAYLIDSEKAITLDAKDGCLYCKQDNERSRDETPFVIPDEFPKGCKAFWYMKYELSSQAYVDFLNSLTRKQQQAHVRSDISTDAIENYYVMTNTNTEKFRQSIVCQKKGNGTDQPITFYTYAPARACNAIAWADVAAYAAWAGLRPVTELEFEKACRGPEKAVASECAWGSNEIGRVDTFDGPDGSGYERKVPTSGLVNACFGGGIAPFDAAAGKTTTDNPGFEGPVSCGLFSNTQHEGIPKRLNDGASYYGIMELSGNLWEVCVTFGHPTGRAYKAYHGDGSLDENGYARIPDWPDEKGYGSGARGGVYRSPNASFLAVALRFAGAHGKSDPRYNGGLRVGF
jgi:formylglycine-generating enzyme required for sulfatase activity